MSNNKPWFRANRSGMGFHPATWQGWLILLGCVAAFVAAVVVVVTATR
jgi:hypothetical protein